MTEQLEGAHPIEIDDVLVEALGSGLTHEEAGALVRRSGRTVSRRMTDPHFARRVADRRSAALSELFGELQRLGPLAITTIRAGMTSDRTADQLRAADMALSRMTALHQTTAAEVLLRETRALLEAALAIGQAGR